MPGENKVVIVAKYGTSVNTTTIIVTSSATLIDLTVASEASATTIGDTVVTVTEDLSAGCTYKYKTDTAVTLPELDDELDETWDDWNGEDEITATTDDEIAIVEVVTITGLVKAAGKATVVAKDS